MPGQIQTNSLNYTPLNTDRQLAWTHTPASNYQDRHREKHSASKTSTSNVRKAKNEAKITTQQAYKKQEHIKS